MIYGVCRNISGNIDALVQTDRQFDEFGVSVRVCLGEIVGMYPFVDDCVRFLINRGYVVLQTDIDRGFVGHCDGTFDFRGWTVNHLVEALKFAGLNVSKTALAFLRQLPTRQLINNIGFEGLANVVGGYLYRESDVATAFATWGQGVVFHAAYLDPHVWREDLTGVALSPGLNSLEPHGRILISTGGLGCCYRGSSGTKQPAAVIFDDQRRSIHLVRPMCDARKIFDNLHQTNYPARLLNYLRANEYRSWL